jgi:transcriptional regulator with XRE-family HTH domain
MQLQYSQKNRVKPLKYWIEEKLQERHWKPADLARNAGIKDATLSRILNGDRNAGAEVCKRIAGALDEPAEKVFRLAGLLPATPEPPPNQEKLILRQIQQLIQHANLVQIKEPNSEYHPGAPATGETHPPATTPDDEDIMNILKQLDQFHLREVYNFARWQLSQQNHPINSSGATEPTTAEIIDLMLLVDESSPSQREAMINYLLNLPGQGNKPEI